MSLIASGSASAAHAVGPARQQTQRDAFRGVGISVWEGVGYLVNYPADSF